MRILCDHNVASKYVQALSRESWLTVLTVRERLSSDASDAEIASFAADEGWVVLANDDDFYHPEIEHGLLVYSQIDDPRPGAVVEAVASISSAYVETADIVEVVPDGWV